MEESESAAMSDEISIRDSVPGGHSVLEISGPTIPSPGPSGKRWISSLSYLLHYSVAKSI